MRNYAIADLGNLGFGIPANPQHATRNPQPETRNAQLVTRAMQFAAKL